MKIMLVAGARPNFMKIASIIDAIRAYNVSIQSSKLKIHHCLVHTGQHYDGAMSGAFFRDLNLPTPDVHLGVGSGSHSFQTAEIMKRFEPVLLEEQPDVVLVVGDVNSTIACSLVASKIEYPTQHSTLSTQNLRRKPLLAHVESGLRSFDRSMPEEINRMLTDQLSDFLFVSEESGLTNLKNEGFKNFLNTEGLLELGNTSTLNTKHSTLQTENSTLNPQHSLPLVAMVGNTMIDTLLKHRGLAQNSTILERLGLKHATRNPQGIDAPPQSSVDGFQSSTLTHNSKFKTQNSTLVPYGVLTLHRPSNVDDRAAFQEILEALLEVSKRLPIIFPIHPRTLNRVKEFAFEKYFSSISGNSKLNIQHSTLGEGSTFNIQHSTLAASCCGIHCVDPLGYLDFLCLISNASLVLTDSGGIQEETTILGVPCVTLRENTERPITITHGTNVLAGWEKETIIRLALSQLKKSRVEFAKLNIQNSPLNTQHFHSDHSPLNTQTFHNEPSTLNTVDYLSPPLWDGNAGKRIISILVGHFMGDNKEIQTLELATSS